MAGTSDNIHTHDEEMVMVGPVTFNASGDTITITDADKIYWAIPCIVNPTQKQVFCSGTSETNDSTGAISITVTDGTGQAYILALLNRD